MLLAALDVARRHGEHLHSICDLSSSLQEEETTTTTAIEKGPYLCGGSSDCGKENLIRGS